MSDLIDDDETPGNAPEFSVSEISGAVKRTVEGAFSHVRVRGEVGRLSRPRSGHIYLDLKDDRSVLAGVIWKGISARLAHQPEEGMEVVATGRITTFPGQSKYQLVIEDIRPAGVGALMAMLEKRRAALAAEGLFDEARKQPLPYLPEVIGVVTSPSGAVIRDILHRLRDRFPRKVLIWPVAVQGERCAPEVSNAIKGFNAMTPGGALPRPDLLIVARGGGSLEDLWGFNEEAVVRAAAGSDIPLISAVGHETDTTLIDFASDKRAPTPTAAAEMAVPVRLELLAWVEGQGGRLSRGVAQAVSLRKQRLGDLGRGLPRLDALLETPRQRLDRAVVQLGPALRAATQDRRNLADRLSGRLTPALEKALNAKRIEAGRVGAGLVPGRLASGLRTRRETLSSQARRLRPRRLTDRLEAARARFAEVDQRFTRVAVASVAARRERVEALERLRQTLGYTETLRRGYAVVREGETLVTTQAAAAKAAHLEIEFADGRLGAIPGGGVARKPAGKSPRGSAPKPSQGSLFDEE
ncbi:exodeoxyribonuclease VII large subunit [Roseobacter sp. HKCCD9010]|uniref:exodeoxyribonuclease VII large subunit n=1 Tax=unclassified Roseobacter TaxID=196798 RepID=UPI0014911F4F|nr:MULTISPECIES: exodeoxyribonuclease VII large subunit [unclassified Roseobacter]MBF9049214.1 exodeoxyribonuclease VII large subunit [Rhodobacterales bacterium HKCCD4356]NNV11214.1 exodeoxyribonuclease VII large subunit [Roseobacter sp. HKCCD7357]NNV15398.1 exodeoxyribonuclease VII large subunit [Roseobacter sp. HKCCD8768]NNV24858.1 exodeoxyribonuclease VII large subunit [Roseobacter sp. HKCCD8192]NNV29114.1 exodeoxyribonuclease VII large subunit [Roseobacter sp. HKCCD9061]